ncbi:hypothetical protein JW868_01245, partial [Candidatus Woesearchaeota archaeon]|nr:hypothetical protein [Candidatus Woesearchaeota archaeon]
MAENVLIEEPPVELTPFPKGGKTGVADSIKAVQESSGLIRSPSYALVIARAVAPQVNSLWDRWYDLDEEQVRVIANQDFRDVSAGDHRLFLVGCTMFSHDTDAINKFVNGKGTVDGKRKIGLTNYSVPLSQAQIGKVLGDRTVYTTGADGKPQEQVVDRIMTYDQF